MTQVSLLVLLHPDGTVEGAAVEGAAAQTMLALPDASAAGPLDLVVLAPSAAQAAEDVWLETRLDALVPRLTGDALVYVLVPPGKRRRARHALRRVGLEIEVALAHVPTVESSRYLVPLERRGGSAAFGRVVAVWPRRRRLLAVFLRLPWASGVLGRLLPSVALVARRPGARPLAQWASALVDDGVRRQVAALVTSGRAECDRVAVLAFPGSSEEGSVVGKVRAGGSGRLEREVEALTGLGTAARAAGAAVPEPIGLRALGSHSVLFETGLAGESAAALLASRPNRLTAVLELVADWLDRWHRATLVERTVQEQELDSAVLAAAEVLLPHLQNGERYVSWLRERCAVLAGAAIPCVATHNDLTMFNVLVGTGRLGVVDWEEANEGGLPLTDFFYAAVDAVAAAARYANRMDAFEACFAPAGRRFQQIAQFRRRLTETTGASAELSELAFHACWLRHAANERLREASDPHPPFLAIVQRLAAGPEAWSASAPA